MEKIKCHEMEKSNRDIVFDPDVLVHNTAQSELNSMMQDIVQNINQTNFQKYFNVSISSAFDDLIEIVSQENKHSSDLSQLPTRFRDHFGIRIMKCQPSSKQYCEKATMDLYR